MRCKDLSNKILEFFCPYCKIWFDDNDGVTCTKCEKSLNTLTLFMHWKNKGEPNRTDNAYEKYGYHGEKLNE